MNHRFVIRQQRQLSETYNGKLWVWIDEALSNSDSLMNSRDIARGVEAGVMDMRVVIDNGVECAVYVTEIAKGWKGKALNVLALGGEGMGDWIAEVVAELETRAKSKDCKLIVEMGRRGWKSVLESFGWREGSTVMVKEL